MQSKGKYNKMEIMTRKRSVALSKSEFSFLKNYRKKFDTEVACAVKIGIDRNVLSRVILTGSGSPETIEKIRLAISRGKNG